MTMIEHEDVAELICQLCRQFYRLGWVSGTGGGISIRDRRGIWMAPSGVQKERLCAEDIWLLDETRLDACKVLRAPTDLSLRVSECQPLFYNAFRLRNAGAVIHSHSVWAVLAARLASPSGGPGTFVSRGFEMQKGLRGKGSLDEVRIPIIANAAREAELTEAMAQAMARHDDVDAVLVANHGLYAWGETWQEAKTQAECLDWLFRAVVEVQRLERV